MNVVRVRDVEDDEVVGLLVDGGNDGDCVGARDAVCVRVDEDVVAVVDVRVVNCAAQ